MQQVKSSISEGFSSRWGFIFAAAGSAVGLGNIWKFPYITGANGGGAFVLIYIAAVLVIGLPLLVAEISIGRMGRENPVDALLNIIKAHKASKLWSLIGWFGILAAFLVLSYYSVVAGWTLDYTVHSFSGNFENLTPVEVGNLFDGLLANPGKLLLYYTIIIFVTGLIIARGISKGIEKAVFILFPVLVIILLALVFYAAQTGFLSKGLSYLFHPDFSKISDQSILAAIGHALFSLSLGIGTMITYGAYLPKKVSIGFTAVVVTIFDTVIALLAGITIFPIVFAHGLTPSAGPGLIFKTLPIAFAKLPYGHLFASLFFIMLIIAALTSTISLLEPSIALLLKRTKLSRVKATTLSCAVVWCVGLLSLFSFNIWANFKIFNLTLFELVDFITSNLILPINGFFLAIFMTWIIKRGDLVEELNMQTSLFKIWFTVLRYITPIGILIVLLHGLI